jgi:RNA polymerase sigma-70 factor (ECF subfamily)
MQAVFGEVMESREQSQVADSESSASRLTDIELARDVALGQSEAQRRLGMRLVLRVRRAAHALMAGSPDADDAAQLTLIEILRSAHTYRGDVELERWADGIIARGIVRFSRAVRRRNASLDSNNSADVGGANPADNHVPTTLDEFLSRLPQASREVLVLKHALGHSVEEIAEITQASPSTIRERLLSSRRDLRKLIRRDHDVRARAEGTP